MGFKRTLRRWIRGDADQRQQCMIACGDTQQETQVWLRRGGERWDVTDRHAQVCSAPLIVSVAFEGDRVPGESFVLEFYSRETRLGEIDLVCETVLDRTTLFRVGESRNLCLSPMALQREYAYLGYKRWRSRNSMGPDEVLPSSQTFRALSVLFICPRPVVLVSVRHEGRFNMFPMNLLHSADGGYLVFALKSARAACALTARAGRVAICNVPLERGWEADAMSQNDPLEGINESELPFARLRSTQFDLPIPEFATRVRELEIESTQRLGGHTLFVARVVGDHRRVEGPACFMVHGMFEAWRRSRLSG